MLDNQRKGFKRHMRQCRRCGEIYRSESKYSMICSDCKLPCGGHRQGKRNIVVPKELICKRRKKEYYGGR